MAVQQQQVLPPQYVEDLQKDYGTQLTAATAAPLDTTKFAPTVAAQDPFQTQAYNLAGQVLELTNPILHKHQHTQDPLVISLLCLRINKI
jgi:hypothetical protein